MAMTGAVSRLVISISGIRPGICVPVSEIRLRITVRIVLGRIAWIGVLVAPVIIRPSLIDIRLLIHNNSVPRSGSHYYKCLTESEDRSHNGQYQSANQGLKNS